MILVDSSVWIDYVRGTATPQAERLDALLGVEPIATGDLILIGSAANPARDCNRAPSFSTIERLANYY